MEEKERERKKIDENWRGNTKRQKLILAQDAGPAKGQDTPSQDFRVELWHDGWKNKLKVLLKESTGWYYTRNVVK